MIKNKNKKFVWISLISMGVSLFLGACGESSSDKKEQIFNLVLESEDTLRQEVEAYEMAEDFSEIDGIAEIWKPFSADNNVLVVFEYRAEGVLTSSTQCGFYYSGNDTVSSSGTSWTSGVELTADGDGYSWSEGDNYYYTEKICDNFYYYIAWN